MNKVGVQITYAVSCLAIGRGYLFPTMMKWWLTGAMFETIKDAESNVVTIRITL